MPGLIEDASVGKGRGKEVISVIRSADMVLLVADARDAERQRKIMEAELYNSGFRLNQQRPQVFVNKANTGGLEVNNAVRLTKVSKEGIKEILKEFKFMSGEILIRQDVTQDQVIDALMRNRVYVPAIAVANKVDLGKAPAGFIPISASEGGNLEALRQAIWKGLGLMRVYLKQAGKEPDMEEPLIMKQASVRDVCLRLHRIFEKHFKYARVWGPSAKYPGQKVGIDFKLKDCDIVEIHA